MCLLQSEGENQISAPFRFLYTFIKGGLVTGKCLTPYNRVPVV